MMWYGCFAFLLLAMAVIFAGPAFGLLVGDVAVDATYWGPPENWTLSPTECEVELFSSLAFALRSVSVAMFKVRRIEW